MSDDMQRKGGKNCRMWDVTDGLNPGYMMMENFLKLDTSK